MTPAAPRRYHLWRFVENTDVDFHFLVAGEETLAERAGDGPRRRRLLRLDELVFAFRHPATVLVCDACGLTNAGFYEVTDALTGAGRMVNAYGISDDTMTLMREPACDPLHTPAEVDAG